MDDSLFRMDIFSHGLPMLNGATASHSGSKDQSLYGQSQLKCVEQAQKWDMIEENWDEG
ncbi:hypothetical protein LV716_01220 [Flagellimonas sp. HMM57]|uniref:hypothetical protein n=2 Tax=unclassified Flagellimonas TaxID=2644544 RepID=UPI001F3DB65B|nr:hypothetical protein [Flagellimonas sp. HMM57]UII76434.1 hypothetical protein LV716_01220 [Flagellimonas sp. HMM57]